MRSNGAFLEARSGSIKPTDALIIARLMNRHRPFRILEVGSFLGVSTRWLMDVSASWQARVTAVDPNIPHRVFSEPRYFLERLTDYPACERLEIVTAFFGQPLCDFPSHIPVIREDWGRTFDMVFIDGDHAYEAVRDNFLLAMRFLSSHGIILFHDVLSWPDVNRFINELKVEYEGKAEVGIHGEYDRGLLKLIRRSNDGIGFFKLKQTQSRAPVPAARRPARP